MKGFMAGLVAGAAVIAVVVGVAAWQRPAREPATFPQAQECAGGKVGKWESELATPDESPHLVGGQGLTPEELAAEALADALAVAVRGLPELGPAPGPTERGVVTHRQERRFRELLTRGVPVALGGDRRDTSQRIAAALGPDWRERWLTAVLERTAAYIKVEEARFGRDARRDGRPALPTPPPEPPPTAAQCEIEAWAAHMYGAGGHCWPYLALEAVANLSSKRVTRERARALFERRAAAEHARDFARYQSAPTLRVMEIWE